MLVRPVVRSDFGRLKELMSAALRTLGSQEGWTDGEIAHMIADHTSEEGMRQLSEKQEWLVACQDAEVVGLVTIWRNEIARLYVDPRWHRRGIGRTLFNAAERAVTDSGFSEIRTCCFPASASFYKAMGMSVQGRQPCHAECFAGRELLVMSKELSEKA